MREMLSAAPLDGARLHFCFSDQTTKRKVPPARNFSTKSKYKYNSICITEYSFSSQNMNKQMKTHIHALTHTHSMLKSVLVRIISQFPSHNTQRKCCWKKTRIPFSMPVSDWTWNFRSTDLFKKRLGSNFQARCWSYGPMQAASCSFDHDWFEWNFIFSVHKFWSSMCMWEFTLFPPYLCYAIIPWIKSRRSLPNSHLLASAVGWHRCAQR